MQQLLTLPQATPWHARPGTQRCHGVSPQRPASRRAQRLVVLAHGQAIPMYLPDETGRDPLAAPSSLPLLGKHIMVTAPRQYAQKLCGKLLNAGARPAWVPGVMITQLNAAEHATEVLQMDQALKQLMTKGHGYTHIAFTSKNGIHAVLQRLAYLAGGLDAACEVLSRCGAQLCALGADGQVLANAGLTTHVSPKEASTLGLVKELQDLKQAAGARVLCPVPLVTGGLVEPPVVPRFLAALEAAGAHPIRLPAYVTSLGATPESCAAERQLLRQGHVQAIAFSSTAEAQGLAHLMGGVPALTAAIKEHHVLLAAHGPYTAQGVSQVLGGLPVPCVSQNFHTFDGLVTALEKSFTGHSHSGAQHEASKAGGTAAAAAEHHGVSAAMSVSRAG